VGWTNYLDARGSVETARIDVASVLRRSPEGFGVVVTSYFQTFLGRTPSPADRDAFANALSSGAMRENDFIVILTTSGEYAAQNPGNDGFVRGIYMDILGRAASQAEVNTRVGQLNSGGITREGMVRELLGSLEYGRRYANINYQRYLNRNGDADPAGRDFWANLLITGVLDQGGVDAGRPTGAGRPLGGFLTSQEFFNNATA
jgi:hypothetical protein